MEIKALSTWTVLFVAKQVIQAEAILGEAGWLSRCLRIPEPDISINIMQLTSSQ